MEIDKKISKSQIVLKPSQFLLKTWKICMALEIIRQFQADSNKVSETANVDNIINLFDKSGCKAHFLQLHQVLEQQADALRLEFRTVEDLAIAKQELEELFFGEISVKIQQISQNIQKTEILGFKKILVTQFKQAYPAPVLSWLEQLSQVFRFHKNQHDRMQIYYVEQQTAAFKSYNNLNKKKWNINFEDKISHLWNAIVLGIKSMLFIEEQKIFSRMFFDLAQLCLTYTSYVENSVSLLKEIENSLLEKSNIDLISLPVFTLLKRLDVKKEQKLLEVWVGHCLNYWGNAPVSWLQIESKLLNNLTFTAESVLEDFHH